MIDVRNCSIKNISRELEAALQEKIDQKAKPEKSLGMLEELALTIGLIQNSLNPELGKPVMLVAAADHGITVEQVSPSPKEITWQQCLNFLDGGGAIGLFCNLYGFDLYVIDAGVDFDFLPHNKLIEGKIAYGTNNFLKESAMSKEQCLAALSLGAETVRKFSLDGVKTIGFGEMGIGNTSSASALMAAFTGYPVELCTGPGVGLNSNGVSHKVEVIRKVIKVGGISQDPLDVLAEYGGYEIACIAGGMIQAAADGMIILVDGFIASSAILAASAMHPEVLDYAIFTHQSQEPGHKRLLNYLNVKPILQLGMRLGEGTGAAVAFPILQGAVAMLVSMTSFEDAKVTNSVDLLRRTKS